jgi:hypothetical protein
MPSPSPFTSQIDNRLPCPPTFVLLLTLPLSSPKQTDFRNVVSSHPYFRHGFICTPGRRRRRRHLSYMRGCLHLQQQNYRSNSYSLPSQQPSALIPKPHSLGTVENKTHPICRSPHSNSSSYFKSPYDTHALQKAKQKHRWSQAPWSSFKDSHPHKAARWCYLECKRQKVHQAQVYGQRHDRKVLQVRNDRR